MEAVAHILPVRYIFNDPVFHPELVYLHAAQILCRSSVDGIEMPVRFFKLVDLFINMLQYLQGKRAVFYQKLSNAWLTRLPGI